MIPAPELSLIPVSMLDEAVDVVLGWARAALAAAGYRVSAEPPEVRRRAWSTVIRLATDRGPVWVKANARDFAPEAALLLLLSECVPDQVLRPIAADPVRGRFITADGGAILLESGPASESDWIALLTGYATLQRTVAPQHAELLRLGLPDMTPPRLTDWYCAVLDRVHHQPAVRRLFPDPQLRALDALIPTTARLAAELGRSPLPMTVEHNDLHTNNVFVSGGPDIHENGTRGLRIFDWGDAVVTHPFIGLGRALRVATEPPDPTEPSQAPRVAADGESDPAAPGLNAEHLRDAYLRCWLPTGTAVIPPVIRRAATLAETLSDVAMAASWLRIDVAERPDRAAWFGSFITRYAATAARL